MTPNPVELKAGVRLSSQVCETQVVVVRAPGADAVLECGGVAMVTVEAAGTPTGEIDPAHAAGTVLGKRYNDTESGIEVLCTRGGAGSLALGGTALAITEPRQLPSSD